MNCPSTMALAVALVPGADTDDVRFGQLLALAITLSIALLSRVALEFV
jgi:hypothetical protein